MDNFKTSNFGVEELNTNEAAEINGGTWPWGHPIFNLILKHLDDIKEGFTEEWNGSH